MKTETENTKAVILDKIIQGSTLEVLKTLPDNSVNCVVTSPPYWALRDYGIEGQLGLEPSFYEYIDKLLEIFDEVKRILKDDGTCWVNLGDTYSSSSKGTGGKTKFTRRKGRGNFMEFSSPLKVEKIVPDKSLYLIPFRFATQMVERGWIMRNVIIWHKPNAMPQSVKDRFSIDFEYIFFFTKKPKYYFKQILEPLAPATIRRAKSGNYSVKNQKGIYTMSMDGWYSMRRKILNGELKGRNKRAVWSIATTQFRGGHFAVYPKTLVRNILTAGCPPSGVVLDPFIGSGTTAIVAKELGMHFIGIDINPEYIKMAEERIKEETNINLEGEQ